MTACEATPMPECESHRTCHTCPAWEKDGGVGLGLRAEREKTLSGFASAELGMGGASISEELTYGCGLGQGCPCTDTDEVIHPKLPTIPPSVVEHAKTVARAIERELEAGRSVEVANGPTTSVRYEPPAWRDMAQEMDARLVQQATAEANAKGVGFKADAEKPRWDLLDLRVEEDVVRVLTHGAKKYADGNWKKVPGARQRYLAAALRHLAAYQAGELADAESGLPHLAHAACCLHFLAWFDREGK